MEEEVGFEPTVRVNVRQFSRLLQSTALALLHTVVGCILLYVINFYCQADIKEANRKIRCQEGRGGQAYLKILRICVIELFYKAKQVQGIRRCCGKQDILHKIIDFGKSSQTSSA